MEFSLTLSWKKLHIVGYAWCPWTTQFHLFLDSEAGENKQPPEPQVLTLPLKERIHNATIVTPWWSENHLFLSSSHRCTHICIVYEFCQGWRKSLICFWYMTFCYISLFGDAFKEYYDLKVPDMILHSTYRKLSILRLFPFQASFWSPVHDL